MLTDDFFRKKTVAGSRSRVAQSHMFVKYVAFPVALKEILMHSPRTIVRLPTGFSFDIPDLVLLQGWSDFHDLRMAIELDVHVDGEEYEELVGLYQRTRAFRRWMIWRSCDGIVVQPAMGHRMLFDSMADTLEILIRPGN